MVCSASSTAALLSPNPRALTSKSSTPMAERNPNPKPLFSPFVLLPSYLSLSLSSFPSHSSFSYILCFATMSRHPTVKWAQKSDMVYITIELPDAKDVKLKLEPEGKFCFSAVKDGAPYEVEIELFDKINLEESKYNIGVRHIVYAIQKAEEKWWTRLLKQEGKPPAFLKVDWDKWVDEDEDDGKNVDFGDMDFSKFNMGGAGDFGMGGPGGFGMGGPGDFGMGGPGDFGMDDADDDEDEPEGNEAGKDEFVAPAAEKAKAKEEPVEPAVQESN